MNRIIDDIREARRLDKLPKCFRAADVRRACPGRAETTYLNFLSKHRVDNPGRYAKKYNKKYFKRHARGLYSLLIA